MLVLVKSADYGFLLAKMRKKINISEKKIQIAYIFQIKSYIFKLRYYLW